MKKEDATTTPSFTASCNSRASGGRGIAASWLSYSVSSLTQHPLSAPKGINASKGIVSWR